MKPAKYCLVVLLAIPVVLEALVLFACLTSDDPFLLPAIGLLPFAAGPISGMLFAAVVLQFVVHLGISIAVYLGEAWARILLLFLLLFGSVSVVAELMGEPTFFGFFAAAYCAGLGYALTVARPVRRFLDSQEAKWLTRRQSQRRDLSRRVLPHE